MTLTRREFIGAGAAAAASAIIPAATLDATTVHPVGEARQPLRLPPFPVVVASANGIRGVATAYEQLMAGKDTLDAIIAGVNIQELDPNDTSVGLGGLPNADGVVQLDASCMHGPTKRAGGVACIERIATPSLVAKAVMDFTSHVLLVGEGATRFAIEMGFKEQDLLTPASRAAWLRWRSRLNANDNWLDITNDMSLPGTTGTINMNAVNAAGDISSVTTTSGLSWKIPGRVGDSPIIGAGQYCDNTVGAAGSTGRGESVIKVCASFLIVEQMRAGKSPEQAIMYAMERVIAMTETRLLGDRGRPRYDVNFYAVAKDGRYAGGAFYSGARFAVADEKGARLENCASLFPAAERPR
jgi:N4-(beta-N-acetylglucosaminyl)-L-asparaginase